MFHYCSTLRDTSLTLSLIRALSSSSSTGLLLLSHLACIPISKDSFVPTIGGDKYFWGELTNFTNGPHVSFVGAGKLLANQLFITLLNMQLNKGIVSFHVNIYITSIDGSLVHRVYNIIPVNGIMTEKLLSQSLRGVASSLTGINASTPISSVQVVASFSL